MQQEEGDAKMSLICILWRLEKGCIPSQSFLRDRIHELTMVRPYVTAEC